MSARASSYSVPSFLQLMYRYRAFCSRNCALGYVEDKKICSNGYDAMHHRGLQMMIAPAFGGGTRRNLHIHMVKVKDDIVSPPPVPPAPNHRRINFLKCMKSCLRLSRGCQKHWSHYRIFFCKPVFFISGLILSHAFVDSAVIFPFITYIKDNWHQTLPKAAAIVNVQEGLATIFRLIIVHIADAHMGYFKIVAFTTALYILGLMLLIFAPHTGLLPLLLMTVGIAGRGPILKPFLAKHVTNTQEQNANNVVYKDQVVARTNVWWSVVWFLGAVTSVISFLLFPLDYTTAFVVSAAIMGSAYVLFWSGFFCYDLHHEPTECLFSIVFRVFKVAVLKRFLSYPTNGSVYFEKDSNEVLLLPHNPIFRVFSCLDKAAIPETSFPDQERQQGKLCTIEEVNRVKKILGLLPMWATLLIYALVEATGSTFFVEQVDSSKAIKFFGFELPINAFSALESLVSSTVPYLFNLLIPKQWNKNKEKRQLIVLLRIGLGMMCSILCCVTASKVEVHRLNSITMSACWLFPQFILLGIMEGLVRDGLCEFFYNQVDESMKHYESSLNDCVMGIGKFLSVICVVTFKGYFGDSVDESRLDKYYLNLAALSCGNLLFYVLVACIYSWKESTPQTVTDIEAGDAEFEIVLTSTSSEITNKTRDNPYKRWRSLEEYDDMANKKLLPRSRTFQ